MLLKLLWDKPASPSSGWPSGALTRSACCPHHAIPLIDEVKLYLITLFDGQQLLAHIAFAFPHRVHTGEDFSHQEDDDRARIPSRMQSEVRNISSRPSFCCLLPASAGRLPPFVTFEVTQTSP